MKNFVLSVALVALAAGFAGPGRAGEKLDYELVNVPWHQSAVGAVGLSRDGKVAVSAGWDGNLFVWETKSGKLLSRSKIPAGKEFMQMAVSPTGEMAALAGPDKALRLFGTRPFRPISSLTALEAVPADLAFSADGRHLAVAMGKTVRLMPSGPAAEGAGPFELDEPVTSLAWLPDGRLAVGKGGEFGSVVILDRNGAEVQEMSLDTPSEKAHPSSYITPPNVLAVSKSGRLIAAGTYNSVEVWSVKSGLRIDSIAFEQDMGAGVTAVAFGHEGKRVYSVKSGVLKVFDLTDGRGVWQLELPRDVNTAGTRVVVRPDHDLLLFGEMAGAVELTTLVESKRKFRVGGPGAGVHSLAFLAGTTRLYGGCDDGTVRLWNAEDGSEVGRFDTGGKNEVTVAVSPDGKWLAVGEKGGGLSLRDPSDFKLVRTLQGHTGMVVDIRFSVDSQALATASNDGTARIWSVGGDAFAILKGHEAQVTSVALSSDRWRAATASEDGTVRLWNLADGSQLAVLEPKKQAAFTTVRFSPDGDYLYGAEAFAGKQALRVWSVNERKLVRSITHEDFGVMELAFLAGGDYVATANLGSSLTIWDTHTGELANRFRGFNGYGFAVAVSDDGQFIALGTAEPVNKFETLVSIV